MQEQRHRVYLAHGESASRRIIQATLEKLTHRVELSTDHPATLIRRCQENPPDIAIVGTEFAGTDVFAVSNELSRMGVCPVLMVIRPEDVHRMGRLMVHDLTGVIVSPASDRDFRPAIFLAERRFQQARQLRKRCEEINREISGLADQRSEDES
ncbi:ANTAR domain-containing response regulator [Roseiconus lacunae]|uniref:Nitrogen regulation protein n=1 Tax=Roseiconus lacunae TaxID=2605694 RepID=A0ABT7PL64_9BACT|nr:nitrogen regulation protein [Roseiconus lacunae]MCD0462688.1 nitrogen regulation protein [Roseiconus lacunae]MDM4017225.1 nitrogen regulation protein [Roseiconus lacunae]WRQ51197.1 nitrogen regulation protein [Stieleria sp. HD01]